MHLHLEAVEQRMSAGAGALPKQIAGQQYQPTARVHPGRQSFQAPLADAAQRCSDNEHAVALRQADIEQRQTAMLLHRNIQPIQKPLCSEPRVAARLITPARRNLTLPPLRQIEERAQRDAQGRHQAAGKPGPAHDARPQ